MGTQLRHQPLPAWKAPLDDWLAVSLVPHLKGICEGLNYAGHEVGRWACLVGAEGRLFEVDSDFDILEPDLGFTATGSGGEYALGGRWRASGTGRHRSA